MVGRRTIARVAVQAAVLAAVLAVPAAGSAAASAPPVGNAAFARAGVQVYPVGAVGASCRVFGFCDGVAGALADAGQPRYRSSRAGEAVLVTCRSADLAEVVGFFGTGDDVVTGWANAGAVRMRSDDPVPACGSLA